MPSLCWLFRDNALETEEIAGFYSFKISKSSFIFYLDTKEIPKAVAGWLKYKGTGSNSSLPGWLDAVKSPSLKVFGLFREEELEEILTFGLYLLRRSHLLVGSNVNVALSSPGLRRKLGKSFKGYKTTDRRRLALLRLEKLNKLMFWLWGSWFAESPDRLLLTLSPHSSGRDPPWHRFLSFLQYDHGRLTIFFKLSFNSLHMSTNLQRIFKFCSEFVYCFLPRFTYQSPRGVALFTPQEPLFTEGAVLFALLEITHHGKIRSVSWGAVKMHVTWIRSLSRSVETAEVPWNSMLDVFPSFLC